MINLISVYPSTVLNVYLLAWGRKGDVLHEFYVSHVKIGGMILQILDDQEKDEKLHQLLRMGGT